MIGYKNTNNKLQLRQEVVEKEDYEVEDLIKMKGVQMAHQVLLEYFSESAYPLMINENRDEFFMKKLRKIRERYFESI
ncbi:hypothetical protein [Empedobacter sp.]|uniref:hypothetical protein n=1 Tax=Empedobacter sp. TaxID=1927715 RepID=UPI0028966E09|nr:hypothetical protein [Empedobacter sp.]